MVRGTAVPCSALLAALVVSFGAGAPASAQSPSVVELATRTASAQWPKSPCRGREIVTSVPQAVLDLQHLTTGFAADALAATCTVRLAASAGTWSGPRLCALLQHEFGHLAGRPHTNDSRDVMFEGVIPWTMPCTRAFPPPRARSKKWRCRTVRGASNIVWRCKRRSRHPLRRA